METCTSRQQFDRQAPHYNAQWNTWNQENLQWMIDHARLRATDRVLDVATGAGFTAMAFAPMAASVVGIDVSGGMLQQARKNASAAALHNITFEEAAAESMPFSTASFDLVTCRIAAHHFHSVPDFLAEARRVLKPGGRLLVADTIVPDDTELDRWQNDVELLRDPSHIRNYMAREWKAFLEGAGFTVGEMVDHGGSIPITFDDWLKKSGCTGAKAVLVRKLFDDAAPAAKQHFRVEPLPDGDLAFAWMRILILAA